MPPLPSAVRRAVELTTEQRDVLEHLRRLPKPVQTLGGYAGTGKTTVIRELLARLSGWAVCAFTGKAANVLRRKGVSASTIHSLIYRAGEDETLTENGRRVRRTRFTLKPRDEFTAAGIIVDEASMVGRKLYDDLRWFGVPLIFVGDHGQLEPVGDVGFGLMAEPDVTLETVHRNANEIARFAEFVRHGNRPADWERMRAGTRAGRRVRFLTRERVKECPLEIWDQVICARNKTRVFLNRLTRELLEFDPDRPCLGDRVMCLQNDRDRGLFNGQQGVVGEIDTIKPNRFRFDADGVSAWVEYVPEQFNRQSRLEYERGGRLPFDYCYCVTCHKAQGDEWDRVLVMEERCGSAWDHSRWAYTAASRARVRLDWMSS